MRGLLLIMFVSLFIGGCSPKIYEHQLNCKLTNEQILAKFVQLVTSEGLTVENQDPKLGFANASSSEDFSVWTGVYTRRFWSITISDGRIYGFAKTSTYTKNVFGTMTGNSDTYYKDDSHQDWGWYWNVRDGLEELCSGKVTIIEKDTWDRKSNKRKNSTN
jgi:hypothetical protein